MFYQGYLNICLFLWSFILKTCQEVNDLHKRNILIKFGICHNEKVTKKITGLIGGKKTNYLFYEVYLSAAFCSRFMLSISNSEFSGFH